MYPVALSQNLYSVIPYLAHLLGIYCFDAQPANRIDKGIISTDNFVRSTVYISEFFLHKQFNAWPNFLQLICRMILGKAQGIISKVWKRHDALYSRCT